MKKPLSFIIQISISLILGLTLNHYVIKPVVTKHLLVIPNLKIFVYFTILIIQILFFYNLIHLIINRNINFTYLNGLGIFYTLLLIVLLFCRPASTRVVNLIPFSSNLTDIITICNVLLFIPLGIFFKKLSILKTILISTLIILLVESVQFIFKVGVFEVDDIIFNVFGITVGAIIARKLFTQSKKQSQS